MLQIKGIFKQRLPKREGTNAKGDWVIGGMVVEYGDEYKKNVALTAFGNALVERIESLQPGESVEVDFEPRSREFNDRWYTDLNIVNIHQAPKDNDGSELF